MKKYALLGAAFIVGYGVVMYARQRSMIAALQPQSVDKGEQFLKVLFPFL
jgi:hypothetical protein